MRGLIMAAQQQGLINPGIMVINDGNTVAWYDSSDLSTITKDNADGVTLWADKLLSGRDLIGYNLPLWTTGGILFNGTDQYMKAAAFTYNQPEQIYMVVKQITYTRYGYFFDGNKSATGLVNQQDDSPDIVAYAGSFSPKNNNLALDTFGIIRVLFNGVNSKLIVNNTTPTTGNFGANNMGGFTLVRNGELDRYYGNIQVKEIVLRNVADTADDEKKIYNYLADKYGFAKL